MRHILSAFVISALAWASAAFAGPPERVTFGPESIDEIPFGQCAGFDVLMDLKYYGEYFVFFDRDGYPDRVFYKQRYPYVLYNSTDPSKRFTSIPSAGDQRWIDIEDGQEVVLFSAGHDVATIPGYGVVMLGVGRQVINLITEEIEFEARGYSVDMDAICSYLAN